MGIPILLRRHLYTETAPWNRHRAGINMTLSIQYIFALDWCLTDVYTNVLSGIYVASFRNWDSANAKYRQSIASVMWMDKGLKRSTTVWSPQDPSVVAAFILVWANSRRASSQRTSSLTAASKSLDSRNLMTSWHWSASSSALLALCEGNAPQVDSHHKRQVMQCV